MEDKNIQYRLDRITNEIYLYFTIPIKPDDTDVLEQQVKYKYIFLNLTKIARDILAVLVAAVGAKRLFSTAGLVITSRRNRLGPDTVYNIIVSKVQWKKESKNTGKVKLENNDVEAVAREKERLNK